VLTAARGEGVIRDLVKLRDELLDFRDTAEIDPAAWSGRSWRWLQKLRGVRTLYGLIVPPEHDALGRQLYSATAALYLLWEAYNERLGSGEVSVSGARLEFERRLAEARLALDRALETSG
jgi:uncharacterized protein YxjI